MAETEVPEIELIIKASTIDGRRKGACIFCQVNERRILTSEQSDTRHQTPDSQTEIGLSFCFSTVLGLQLGLQQWGVSQKIKFLVFQEYFMDLYLLAELKTISLKITTVDMKRPPADFRSNFEVGKLFSKFIFISITSVPGSPAAHPD